jgi:hypothetical protein
MTFSLRTLLLATAIVPVLVGNIAMSFHRGFDGKLRFEWPDPILTMGVIGWIGLCIYAAKRLHWYK